MSSNSNILLDAAIQYAQNGWHVFPCREKPGDTFLDKDGRWVECPVKSPKVTNGLKQATTDIVQIEKWWSNGFSNSAIGVHCGRSKIFVIDVDTHNGVDGINNFHRLGIPDEGCLHQITANKGIHFIYSDPENKGKPKTNKKLGIDCRGGESYIIIYPSFIFDEEGNKKNYLLIDDFNPKPRDITDDILEKLGVLKKQKENRGKFVSNEMPNEKLSRVKRHLNNLSEDVLENYDTWIQVGMALKEFGEDGFNLWEQWTEPYLEKKPSSKRWNKLNYYWDHFNNEKEDKITTASIFFWAQNKKDDKDKQ